MDIKYIKYKTKYLNLKGGSQNTIYTVEHLIEIINSYLITVDKKITDLTDIIKYNKNLLNDNNKDGLTPLNEAIKKNFYSICKLFIENDVDVNKVDKDKTPPLILAWMYSYHDICKLLLGCSKININCQDERGDTLLHIFVFTENLTFKNLLKSNNSRYVIEYIMENGDINVLDNENISPLCYAIISSNLKFICMLRGKKPNADIRCGTVNRTILDLAKLYAHNENGSRILQYLELNYPNLSEK